MIFHVRRNLASLARFANRVYKFAEHAGIVSGRNDCICSIAVCLIAGKALFPDVSVNRCVRTAGNQLTLLF